MSRLLRISVLVGCLLAATSAFANTCTTCYIDYENGNDGWNGASKTFTGGSTGPWKHAPGMLGLTPTNTSTGDGCTANCKAQSPSAGDKYILKGGVVWPYTTLPWQFAGSGNSAGQSYGCSGSGCIYIGVDPTWNKGIVNAITLNRDLGGCTSAPTVTITGGGGSGASAVATVMPSVVNSVEPNVAGFVLAIQVTSSGSGYTSAPMVVISGGGCSGVRAVADVQRAIVDAGARANIAWPVGYGPGPLAWGPGLLPMGSYLIVDNLELRNILQVARAVNGVPDGVITAFLGNEQGSSGHITYSNNYTHGRYTNCSLNSCLANDQEQADRGIILNNPTDEAAYNYLTNGDGFFLSTAANSCNSGIANSPCQFGENGIVGGPGGSAHDNRIYGVRWLTHFGGSGPVPALIYNNEMWLVLYDVGGAHVNEMYSLFTTATLYEYNNVFHSAVSGASNQQQMGNGTTQYFFNNVSWGLGGGTGNYGIDVNFGAGSSGGRLFFYNNTMYSNNGTRDCIDGNSGSFSSALRVVLQNNQCISSASSMVVTISGATYTNQAGSTSLAAVAASSLLQPTATAQAQGYTVSNAFAPTANSGSTVLFANNSSSANLSSLCTGNLTALCSDILGNKRPEPPLSWNAGAYLYTGVPTSPQSLQATSH